MIRLRRMQGEQAISDASDQCRPVTMENQSRVGAYGSAGIDDHGP